MVSMKGIGSAQLAAWTFCASPYASNSCGINGLPLTPNSVRIYGRFQKLKSIIHPHLSSYVEILRGKHERLIVVHEYYENNLEKEKNFGFIGYEKVAQLAFNILEALSFLHNEGIVHRCLCPSAILIDTKKNFRLSNYGLYYMTEGGSCVSFPIGIPQYMSPEVLTSDQPSRNDQGVANKFTLSSPKTDIWSFGMILLEIAFEVNLWSDYLLEEKLRNILTLISCKSGEDVVEEIATQHNCTDKLLQIPKKLLSLIQACLTVNSRNRPTADQLLKNSYFEDFNFKKFNTSFALSSFIRTDVQSLLLNLPVEIVSTNDHLLQCPIEEVFYLWRLAGGDVESELCRVGLIKTRPPACSIADLILEDGEEFGKKKDSALMLNNFTVLLPIRQLKERLKNVNPVTYYPLIEIGYQNEGSLTSDTHEMKETASLPLVIKEKDIEYQLHRIVLYRYLLNAYPYKRTQIAKEAQIDIPPLYRAFVWASLLEVEGDIRQVYDEIDKETPTPTDRQIEVDIPRCHQYNELLTSPTAHAKFKRILKAWVISHPQYVYWQGLDSLCAPFLYLNFNNEALAYSCLSSFIPKYLNNFFLKDNSFVIQEYLAVFSHLIAFHDAELTNHLDSIGFLPELYAISWFLTMFTHIFPLHKIFHLWDTLLLGGSSFPLFIGVALLKQLRNSLLSFGFNECILLFSDMPEIDIQRCVKDSVQLYFSTPKSVTFRHQTNSEKKKNMNHSYMDLSPLPLHVLKSEISPRISGHDFFELINFDFPSDIKRKNVKLNIKVVIVDVRPTEEFVKGAISQSINIPFQLAFSSDGTLMTSSEKTILETNKGNLIVIVGSSMNNNASNFAGQLVRLGYSKVCILNPGINLLSPTGVLVVRKEL